MKKNIIVLFAASSLLYASAQTVVIPDADFKAYLVTSFDADGNGEISAAEAQAVGIYSTGGAGLFLCEPV